MRDLGLNLSLNGRKPKELTVDFARELVPEDLEVFAKERGTEAVPVKALRERHHALARAVATGIKDGDAALMVGYTQSRLSILKTDPAFKELVAFYRKGVNEAYYGMHEALAGISKDAVTVLSERLEEDPEEFTVGQLADLVKMGADRTGHGVSTTTQVDVKIGLADRMDAARKRVELQREAEIIDVTPVEVPPSE